MQQAVQNTSSPLERNLTVSVPIAQIEAEIADAPEEARAHGEDAGLPARQGAAEDGRAPVRFPGAPGSAVATRCSKSFADAVQRPELPRGGLSALPAGAGRAQGATNVEFTATFEVYPEVEPGRRLGAATVTRPVTAVSEPNVDDDARDAAQAARDLRARRARRRRRRPREHRFRRPHRRRQPFEGNKATNFTVVLGERPHAAGLRGGARRHEGRRTRRPSRSPSRRTTTSACGARPRSSP